MSEAIEFLGWFTAAAAFFALSNFFIKEIGRTYIKAMPLKYAGFADSYRNFMKFMIRRHRYFGFLAAAVLPVHAYPVVSQFMLSLTGFMAALGLLTAVGLGIYGVYVKKNMRSTWLPFHRGFAFLFFAAVAAHVFFKVYVPLS